MNMLNKNGVFTYKDDSYDFNFKTSLSAMEKLSFVRNVVDTIVDDKSYDVVIRDLVFDFNIIAFFTNIDTSFIEMKDEDGNDINHIILIEHFLNESNVVDIVKANMEDGVIEELTNAIDLNVQYLTGICLNSVNNSLAKLLSTLEKKFNGVDLDSMMPMVQKFASMTDDFTVDNIVSAYMNSDIHKSNIVEIEKAKASKEEKVEVSESKKSTKKKEDKTKSE